jgi:pantetheine-phosphate adenylyltransferase
VIAKKAIVTTSASPMHFGHLYLYREAIKIFDEENVKIAVGRSNSKNMDIGRIIYHLSPYRISYDIRENITLIDYCRENNISYIVRGVRNANDVNYELKLDFLEKEAYPKIQTMFFPAESKFNGISSSFLNRLLAEGKFDSVKNYMDEDSMYRFLYRSPEFIVFFGKSCSGKTHYLKNTLKFDNYLVEVDKIFWKIFEERFGHGEMLKTSFEGGKSMCQKIMGNDLALNYLTADFWKLFFNHVSVNFSRVNFTIENLKITKEVFILDFPEIGNYWSTIDASLRSKFYMIKLSNTLENRKKYAVTCNLLNKLDYLDSIYREPNYFDEEKNIDENCL